MVDFFVRVKMCTMIQFIRFSTSYMDINILDKAIPCSVIIVHNKSKARIVLSLVLLLIKLLFIFHLFQSLIIISFTSFKVKKV